MQSVFRKFAALEIINQSLNTRLVTTVAAQVDLALAKLAAELVLIVGHACAYDARARNFEE